MCIIISIGVEEREIDTILNGLHKVVGARQGKLKLRKGKKSKTEDLGNTVC